MLHRFLYISIALAVLVSGLAGKSTLDWFVLLPLFVLLAAIAWIDFQIMRIPNTLNATLFIGGTALGLWSGSPAPQEILAGSLAGFGSLWLIATGYMKLRGKAGLGMGDAKFLGAAGAWTGPYGLPFILLIASLSGLLYALAISARRPENGRQGQVALPFGPFLALGLWFTLTIGHRFLP